MILSGKILLSYLAGSVNGGLVVGRLRGGIDIRTLGSGNAGGTNALRTQGPWFALAVVIIDIGKGALAAGPIAAYGGPDPLAAVLCGAAAVLGHIFPLWHGFRGGKGAATLIGVIAVLQWQWLLPICLFWLAVVVLSGYVGLATMLTATAVALYAWFGGETSNPYMAAFATVMAATIIYSHRSNIARMRAGRENRNETLWLFSRKR